MTSRAEWRLCQLLQSILAELAIGAAIPESDPFREWLAGLEYFLPEVLREVHPEWENESLGGVLPLVAKKTGIGEAEVSGQCILISDQTLTPIHLRIQLSADANEIQWLELRLGERTTQGMLRTPCQSGSASLKRAAIVAEGGPNQIDWCYRVTFGERLG